MLTFTAAYYSEAGGRPTNQDCADMVQKDNQLLLVVADGVGGYRGGERASQIAVDTVRDVFLRSVRTESTDHLVLLAAAEVEAATRSQNEHATMRTTIAAVLCDEMGICCSHVGDSRIYIIRDKMLAYVSRDHSVRQQALDQGAMPEPGSEHIITRALGEPGRSMPDSHRVRFMWKAGDAVLVCSDGFWELTSSEEIMEHFSASLDAETWLNSMMRSVETRQNMNSDNCTCVVVYFGESED